MNAKLSGRSPLAGLLCAQFLGAFNDNAWKIMVFTLATRPFINLPSADFELSSQTIATLSMLIFLLPMMLFSIPGGFLADYFSKRQVLISTKLLEVVIMGSATLSLYLAPLELALPFTLLGMMGLQSAFFSPAKYGILPEILPAENLAKGNGLLEMWTMISIIAGTGIGPVLLSADKFGARPQFTWIGAACLTFCSLVGLMASWRIPSVKIQWTSSSPSTQSLFEALKIIRRDRMLVIAFLGSLLYWSVLSLLGQNVLVYAKSLAMGLEKGEIWQGIPPAAFGLGIACGALLAARYSGKQVEIGLIPLGAIFFSASSLLLGLIQPGMGGTIFILIFMGCAGGMLIVPLHTLIQMRAPDEKRGAIIALGNILDILGMLTGSLVAMGMAMMGLGIGQMLIFSSLLVIFATILAIQTLPAALVRLLFIVLTRTVYHLKIRGLENVPTSGSFIIISNHISLLDTLFVMASLDRPVHFIMNEDYYNRWWLHPLARLMEAIPLSNKNDPKHLEETLKRAGDYLDQGEVVCVFPEGQISHMGILLPFQKGMDTLLHNRDCPVVPLYIDGIWGSIFSFKGGKFFRKCPEYRPYSLKVFYGPPIPALTPLHLLRRSLQELEYQAWMARREEQKSLTHTFIQNVRQKPWALALCDEKTSKMTRLEVLTQSILVGRLLKTMWQDQPFAVLMFPTSIPAVICNLAVILSGKAVINLDVHLDKAVLFKILEQTNTRKILTSYAHAEKLSSLLPENIECLYFEDLKVIENSFLKWSSCWMALFYSEKMIELACGGKHEVSSQDPLAVIFTSGSTDYPKGVVLSHFNMHSNVDGVAQVLPGLAKSHRLIHSLPLSHSLGYMMMWLGLNHQQGLILHHNPSEFPVIGDLVEKFKATLMLTTPTLLKGYLKSVPPKQFGSLRCLITGAEKLHDSLAKAFERQFGICPMEGYGATECSPVVATSTLNVRDNGICQVGMLPGYVGKPLPGILVKIVDPVTLLEKPPGQIGLLLVKGPNVMQGYYKNEDLTQKVLHDDWYQTGDLAELHPEGFLKILDRLVPGESVIHRPDGAETCDFSRERKRRSIIFLT